MATQLSPLESQIAAIHENSWLRVAHMSELCGEANQAINAYVQVLHHNPANTSAATRLGYHFMGTQNFPKACEYFERALHHEPSNDELWKCIAHCYLLLDDSHMAHRAYQRALNHFPKDAFLWYGMGLVMEKYNRFDDAANAFSRVLQLSPGFPHAREVTYRLGVAYHLTGKQHQALEKFNLLLQQPPTDPTVRNVVSEEDILYQIGHVHEKSKHFDQARETYERILEKSSHNPKVLLQLGWLHFSAAMETTGPAASAQISKAITRIQSALEQRKEDGWAWYLLGRCYMKLSDYAQAHRAYQQAVYIDSLNPVLWCSIGVLYYYMLQFREALEAYKRAIFLNSRIMEAWLNSGLLYEASNQVADAIDAYTRAAQLDPRHTFVQQRLAYLTRPPSERIPPTRPCLQTALSLPPAVASSMATLFSGTSLQELAARLFPQQPPLPNAAAAAAAAAMAESLQTPAARGGPSVDTALQLLRKAGGSPPDPFSVLAALATEQADAAAVLALAAMPAEADASRKHNRGDVDPQAAGTPPPEKRTTRARTGAGPATRRRGNLVAEAAPSSSEASEGTDDLSATDDSRHQTAARRTRARQEKNAAAAAAAVAVDKRPISGRLRRTRHESPAKEAVPAAVTRSTRGRRGRRRGARGGRGGARRDPSVDSLSSSLNDDPSALSDDTAPPAPAPPPASSSSCFAVAAAAAAAAAQVGTGTAPTPPIGGTGLAPLRKRAHFLQAADPTLPPAPPTGPIDDADEDFSASLVALTSSLPHGQPEPPPLPSALAPPAPAPARSPPAAMS
ncbi:putative General transcriptional corepressor trfA [Paratrimastix pyriformis]|uniref:General transcriptional corepressor trfA n=1 Tax=Paratrimastix pyriformis TaxID=342808 RepID=A0ABQ8UPZ8_9EUKA|nr:putative General transcriptional corepressor trfA [Paratrimastix pyriformis]